MQITLRAARVNAGMSQSEAAYKLSVNISTVSSWENGKTVPSLENFRKLCRLYGWPEDGIKLKEE